MKVQKLDAGVRSKLESGLIITDAIQCVVELVENSLDAKATSIAVRVNLDDYMIDVIDNGIGISPRDLKLIGQRFMTNKCHSFGDINKNIATYGYRGQALASLVDVCSKLCVKTKTDACKNTMIKVFNYGKEAYVGVSEKEKSSTGTTVTVYDFMSTMPVRRKRISQLFDLHGMKTQLEYLAVIHNDVCFTLRDDTKGQTIFQTHKRTEPKQLFSDVYGVSITDANTVPVEFEDGGVEIRGFIGRRIHSERNLQFFYVNKRLVSDTVISKLINRLIDKYLKRKIDSFNELELNISTDLYNVYVIQVLCPYAWVDFVRNMRRTTVNFKDEDMIVKCIKKAVKLCLSVKKTPVEVRRVMDEEDVDLRNGLRGAFVKRRKKSVDLVNDVEGESSVVSERGSDFLYEFGDWFKERIKSDINSYRIYNEFIRDMNCTSGKRVLGIKNDDAEKIMSGKCEKRKCIRQKKEKIKKNVIPKLKAKKKNNNNKTITEVTQSEISIQINTQKWTGCDSWKCHNKQSTNWYSHRPDVITAPSVVEKPTPHRKDMEVQTSITRCKFDKSIQVSSPCLDMDTDGTFCQVNLSRVQHVITPVVSHRDSAVNVNFGGQLNETCESVSRMGISDIAFCSVAVGQSGDDESMIPDTLTMKQNGTPFAVTERYNFIPKGLSQTGVDKSPVVEATANESSDLVPGTIFEEIEEKARDNMVYCEEKVISATMTKSAAEISNILFSIRKESLLNVEIIGQWDNKFIAAILDISTPQNMKVLTIFDQHAVDERIQLERILKESRRTDGSFLSCCCNPPIKCGLDESLIRFVPSLKNKLLDYGVKVEIDGPGTILFVEIPLCLVGENFTDERVEPILKTLISDMIRECNETRGASCDIPTAIYAAVSSKACKGAVKFNEVLTKDTMKNLIDGLVECQVPFQCAHGRPNIVPVLDLNKLDGLVRKKEGVLNYKKFRKGE